MERIEYAINNHEYKKALKALATIIMILNIEIIKKNYIKDFNKMNFYDAMEVYRMKNKEIYNIMLDINYIYELTEEKNKIELDDILELKELCNKLREFWDE